ncbi:Aldo/keto reductase [Epithele typhae]|uniref:Aldo/keto reductase n=1 Tax=Epithele typhae TaxID=378194 RepID=UPI0020079E56|nr:Aldo/keto reductase [Epithele typhae]KAH9931070.1 Aldo/keto reductase [Epithele typhae]
MPQGSTTPLTTPTLVLGNGDRLPQVGMGTWKHTGEKASEAVYNGLKVGYHLIDGACDYGNERECGEGLRRALADGVVRREDVWVVSKLWNTFHARAHVREAVERSLKDWGVDYFDLYYVHFPISLAYVSHEERYPPGWYIDGKSEVKHEAIPFRETWEALEELVDAGLIRHLGVSNMCSALLMDLLKYARIKPSVLQIEIHPYNVQRRAVEYAQAQGLAVTAYSSFGPLGFRVFGGAKALHAQPLFTHPAVRAVAAAHAGASTPQVLLRWAAQRGLAVIPKSDTDAMLRENLAGASGAAGFELSGAEMDAISGLDLGLRFNDPADDFAGCYIFS